MNIWFLTQVILNSFIGIASILFAGYLMVQYRRLKNVDGTILIFKDGNIRIGIPKNIRGKKRVILEAIEIDDIDNPSLYYDDEEW